MQYWLPDWLYTAIKWVVSLCMPALTTCYVGLAAIWGWPYAEEVAKTSAVVCACLGTIMGYSALTAIEAPDE